MPPASAAATEAVIKPEADIAAVPPTLRLPELTVQPAAPGTAAPADRPAEQAAAAHPS